MFLAGGLPLYRVPPGSSARDYVRAWDCDQGYLVGPFASRSRILPNLAMVNPRALHQWSYGYRGR